MEQIPLPSHIHYELLLQLLERQSLFAANQTPAVREQIQQLIITLRKALAQQKQLEATCDRANLPYEYHWSLNSIVVKSGTEVDILSKPNKREVAGKDELSEGGNCL
ncbi:MAG: DUF5340 domain-containing protein [Oscillatoria sp. PMC 1051.18]|uniref:DUF5340 domain-containing protein n=1 Tax=Oscillatoria salina TaxID=331517 RepID=UPI0013BDA1DF|nr:DUF5340 domain-containing protein [Oscillatoria salina]MBZ8179315.1 DUF5340 domain-containing protein [Oscillatoria salina IIICB1]MEC4894376.1 DUF5340 domain-containing protein [Oscillatoria sp. PMC 1050.18]MEC5031828.1 DUF5340 domain-containing protein [Oscillatoria sp. PMC 1051.18]NET87651.1 DUF5340 domain-containing protein [Kamptonema sp. SIO1D9]